MSRTIVNLVHSLQALDVSMAMVLQLRSEDPNLEVVSVLKLARAMRIPSVGFLFETLCGCSDRVVLVGSSPLYDDCSAAAVRRGLDVERVGLWQPPSIAPGLNRLLWFAKGRADTKRGRRLAETVSDHAILLRSHADVDCVTEGLVAGIRARGGVSFAYLEGLYPPEKSLPLNYFEKPRVDLCDRLLLFSEDHRNDLASLGYTEVAVIGYPKLFPAWRMNVERDVEGSDLRDELGRFTVSVFTRGTIPGGGPQILPDETLELILDDLLTAIDERIAPVRILIKPHPLQDVAVIRRVIGERSSASMSTHHPAQLASVADLVITTWSTTTMDALSFGVPCIEYFIPNDYFRDVYPHGSSFRRLGILWAEDGRAFRRCLDAVLDGQYRPPNAFEVFRHRMDLSVFEEV